MGHVSPTQDAKPGPYEYEYDYGRIALRYVALYGLGPNITRKNPGAKLENGRFFTPTRTRDHRMKAGITLGPVPAAPTMLACLAVSGYLPSGGIRWTPAESGRTAVMSLADRLRSPQLIGAVAALAVHISPISAAVRSEEYVAAI